MRLKSHFHHSISGAYTLNKIDYCWCWPCSLELGGICHVSPLLSYYTSLFPPSTIWKEVTVHNLDWRIWEFCSTYLKVDTYRRLLILFLLGRCVYSLLFVYFFAYSNIYSYQYGGKSNLNNNIYYQW